MDLTEAYFSLMREKHGYANNKDVLEHLNAELGSNIPPQYVSNWPNPKSRRLVPRYVAKYMRDTIVRDFMKSKKLSVRKKELDSFIKSIQPTLYSE